MPEINLRDLVGDIREALERHPREALIEILTYVFKEYVVEGPAPLATNTAVGRDDLEGLNFAEVIRTLQLRLDLPELALFEVSGDRVSLKLGGRQVPVEAQSSRPEPVPPPMAAPTPPPPQPSVSAQPMRMPPREAPREVRSTTPGTTRQELPSPTSPVVTRGTNLPTAAPAQPKAPAVANPSAPAAAKDKDEKPTDASGRYKLLEVD